MPNLHDVVILILLVDLVRMQVSLEQGLWRQELVKVWTSLVYLARSLLFYLKRHASLSRVVWDGLVFVGVTLFEDALDDVLTPREASIRAVA